MEPVPRVRESRSSETFRIFKVDTVFLSQQILSSRCYEYAFQVYADQSTAKKGLAIIVLKFRKGVLRVAGLLPGLADTEAKADANTGVLRFAQNEKIFRRGGKADF
jgi:hypothetical protein